MTDTLTAPTASPCTGVCRLDPGTGWCLGCGRDGDEIALWRSEGPDWRARVWAALPDRLAALGVVCRRLPWETGTTRDFARRTLAEGTGTWAMGVVGAVAEFVPAPGARAEVTVAGGGVLARTEGGAILMRIDEDVRALTFDPPETPLAEARVVLAVKRERGRLPAADVLTDLGADREPLLPGDRGTLYDLGLGRKEARFSVRCSPGPARNALASALGRTFPGSLPQIGPALLAESPTRVVETALGRAEVSGPIPPPGGVSPAGPHTHLLPDHLATNRATPVGMDLPRAYLPGAIFYPRR